MQQQVVVGFFVSSLFLQQTLGSFHLAFQINQYSNPSGLQANGLCCELLSRCSDSCDTEFEEICLGPGGSSEACPWSDYVLSPGFIGEQNHVQFADTIGAVSNPFSFTVEQVPSNGFQLYVRVIDDDPIGTQLIDEIYWQIPPTLDVMVTSQTVTGSFERASLIMGYSLTCTQNYYGSDCSTHCLPSDDSTGHYDCDSSNGNKICLPGYQNSDTSCTEVACELVCNGEGGNCSESGVCECSQGWSGEDCSQAQCTDNCHPEGGYCDQPGECLCNTHWNGIDCDQFLCHPNCSPIGGNCVMAGGCDCLPEYTGEYCETDLNPCTHLTPCENGGTCSNGDPNQYDCACPSGYTGVNCEEDIDECTASPCANQATCLDHPGGYQCLCVLGWTGVDCELDVDDCSSQPCQNGGNCSDLLNGYYCSCEEEYEGLNCELMANACIPYPCQNGGSCINLATNYTCKCHSKFIGRNCEISLASSAAGSAVTLSELYVSTTTPNGQSESGQGIVAATTIIGATVSLFLSAAVFVTFIVVLYLVIRRRRKAKGDSSSGQADSNDYVGPSAIFSACGLDNMTYSALPDKSHPSATYAQPQDVLMHSGETYREVDNPLYGSGQSAPEINGDTYCNIVPGSDLQPDGTHYEPVDTEWNNPMYASVSQGGDVSDAVDHYAYLQP